MAKKKANFYVVMQDNFLSGWGEAEGKDAMLILLCDTSAEAYIVKENAEARTDMTRISIRTSKPQFSKERNHVQYATREDMPLWYEKDFFKIQLDER